MNCLLSALRIRTKYNLRTGIQRLTQINVITYQIETNYLSLIVTQKLYVKDTD